MGFTVTNAEREELLVTFACLILNDDNLPITADNIGKLVKAANGKVQPYWPKLFSQLLQTRKVNDLLAGGGAGGPAVGPAAPAAAAAAAAPAK
jgi:large subunit ribosomal protein LP1